MLSGPGKTCAQVTLGDERVVKGHTQKAGFQDRTLNPIWKGPSGGTKTRANCHLGPISISRNPMGGLFLEAGICSSQEKIRATLSSSMINTCILNNLLICIHLLEEHWKYFTDTDEILKFGE